MPKFHNEKPKKFPKKGEENKRVVQRPQKGGFLGVNTWAGSPKNGADKKNFAVF